MVIERVELFDKELVAAKGIIYLMFVGRKIKAYNIAKNLTESRVVSKDSVIYQYVNFLQERGYIKKIEETIGPGSPKIRTANLEPIFETIGASRRLIDNVFFSTEEYSMKDNERKTLESMFKRIGGIVDSFPEYLCLSLNEGTKGLRKLKWKETLSYFLNFCIEVINACHTEKEMPYIKVEDHKKLPPIFGRKTRRTIMMKNSVNEAIRTEKLSKNDLAALTNLTTKGYDDIYKRGSFLHSLYLMALSLTNPEASYFIEKFAEHLSREAKRSRKRQAAKKHNTKPNPTL